jgi:hypothetical protein
LTVKLLIEAGTGMQKEDSGTALIGALEVGHISIIDVLMGGVGEAGVASVEDASVGDEQDKNGS